MSVHYKLLINILHMRVINVHTDVACRFLYAYVCKICRWLLLRCYRARLIEQLKLEDVLEWKWVWENNRANENLKATIPNTDYEGPKTAGEFKIVYVFG